MKAPDTLRGVVEALRGPDGCDWDRRQTLASLKFALVEEAYELLEAIEEGENRRLREELGDVLIVACMLSQIASDEGRFTLDDALNAGREKLVRRHPHVFGEEEYSEEKLLFNWEADKEKNTAGRKAQPALWGAYRASERAARLGFNFTGDEMARLKVTEELLEMDGAVKEGSRADIEEELGESLFALANLSRRLNINPELALKRASERFTKRFEAMSERAGGCLALAALGREELVKLWKETTPSDGG